MRGSSSRRASARLGRFTRVSSVKGDAVVDVISAAEERLPEIRTAGGYDALFAALAAEAFAGLDGDVVVHVAPEDANRAARAAAATSLAATVDPTLKTAGGLVVEAHGGRIIRRNTLEDRLERTRQMIQAEVAKVLFS